jgi:hypothetical protein
MAIDPRNGAPKRPTPITSHLAMRFVRKGKDGTAVHVHGMSKTRDNGCDVTTPRVPKHCATNPAVAVHDAFDVAITPHGRAEVRQGEGKAILDEAEAAFLPRGK